MATTNRRKPPPLPIYEDSSASAAVTQVTRPPVIPQRRNIAPPPPPLSDEEYEEANVAVDEPQELYDDFEQEFPHSPQQSPATTNNNVNKPPFPQEIYDDFEQELPPPPLPAPQKNMKKPPVSCAIRLPPPLHQSRPQQKLPHPQTVHKTRADADEEAQEIYEDPDSDTTTCITNHQPPRPAPRPSLPDLPSDEEIYEDDAEADLSDEDEPRPPPPPLSHLKKRIQDQDARAPARGAAPQKPLPLPTSSGINTADIKSALTRLKPVGSGNKAATLTSSSDHVPDFKSVLKSTMADTTKQNNTGRPPMKPPKPTPQTKPQVDVRNKLIPPAQPFPPQNSSEAPKPQAIVPPTVQASTEATPALRLNVNRDSCPGSSNEQDEDGGEIYDDAASQLSPIDPTLGPKEPFLYRWYHGDISRTETERKLREHGGSGVFLVRKSKAGGESQPYTMTVLYHGVIYVLKIRRRSTDRKMCLGEEKPGESAFRDVAEMVRFHETDDIILMGSQPGATKLTGFPARS